MAQTMQGALEREKASLKRTQQAIVDVNARRKAEQLKAGERLYAADVDFVTMSAKNVQIAAAWCATAIVVVVIF